MRLPLLALSLLTTTLVGCGDDPPTTAEIDRALSKDLGPALHEGVAATDATATLPTGSGFGFATSLGGGSVIARVVSPVAQRIIERVTPTQNRPSTHYLTSSTDTDALVDRLRTELFINANKVDDGVYRVPASMVCQTTTYDETTMMDVTSIDADCAATLDQVQLRVRVEHDGNGLRFFIQLDKNHDEPLSIFVAHDELAVTVNLDDANGAMIALAELAGEMAPNASLKGSITGSVHVLGTAHARFGLAFDRAIAIKFADQGIGLDADGAYRFTSAAGDIVGVELDASAAAGSFDLGVGETTVHIPGDITVDPTAVSKDIDLGGATVNASFTAGAVTLNNLSLGTKTTTVSVGGVQAVAIDLNPDSGRKLDATVSVDAATGDETVSVSPRYDLRQSIDHAVLGDEAPVYDVARINFDGSLRSSSLDSSLQVMTGSLAVETSPAQYGFTASAGQCVTQTDVYDSVTYTSYTQFAVGACQ